MNYVALCGFDAGVEQLRRAGARRRFDEAHLIPQIVRIVVAASVNDENFALGRSVLQDRYERRLKRL